MHPSQPPVPVIGRDDELVALGGLLQAAAAGRGGAVQVVAEPGLGRTALLASLAAIAEDVGLDVVTVALGPVERQLAGSGVHRILRAVLDRDRGAARAGPPTDLLRAVETGPPPEGLHLAVGLLRAVEVLAGRHPLLLCVDDAHHLDPPSAQALAFVCSRLDTRPVAVVATGAATGAADARGGDPLPGVPVLRLLPISRTASLDLVGCAVPAGTADGLAAAVTDLGEGAPAALLDLIGSLTPDQLAGAASPPQTLPRHSRLRRDCLDQLEPLTPPARFLLLLAAADPELDGRGLASAAAEAGIHLDELGEAERRGIVEVTEAKVGFPRAWTRSVVYHEAPLAERRRAHGVLARVTAAGPDPLRSGLHAARAGAVPDEALARQLEVAASAPGVSHAQASVALEHASRLSADPDDAARCRFAAAEQAWLAGDPLRARLLRTRLALSRLAEPLRARADLLEAELALASAPPDLARERLLDAALRVCQTDGPHCLDCLIRTGDALLRSDDGHRFAAMARQVLGADPPSSTPQARLIMHQLEGLTALLEARFADAREQLRLTFGLARELDDPVALVRASAAGVLLGDDAVAHDLASRALRVATERGADHLAPHALECRAHAELALGRLQHAAASLQEGIRLAVRDGRPSVRALHLAWLAVIAAMLGDQRTARLRGEQARARAGSSEQLAHVHALVDWATGLGDLATGRAAEAAARLGRLGSIGGPGGQAVSRVATAPHLVEAAIGSGDRAVAEAAFTAFEPWATQTQAPHWLAVAERCRAMLSTDGEEAQRHFRQADRLHRAAWSPFLRARTALHHGRHLRRARKPEAARGVLLEALAIFERFGATAWADQVRTELRAAGRARDPSPVVPATPSAGVPAGVPAGSAGSAGSAGGAAGDLDGLLTAQQYEVAAMVAVGATNREIAAALFLSVRTVEYHLRNIFSRLGLRSRVELDRRFG